MEQFLNQYPKPLIAVVIIAIAAVVIYYAQPPRTICDSEHDSFQQGLVGDLYPEKIDKKKGKQPGRIRQAREMCKLGNNSGACFDYFNILRRISSGVLQQTSECYDVILEAEGVKGALKEGLILMTNLAWGESKERGPKGWMSPSDLATFCKLKEILNRSLPEEEWNELTSGLLNSLVSSRNEQEASSSEAPKTLTAEQAYPKSLLALNCSSYL